MKNLSDLVTNEIAVISGFNGNADLQSRLVEMGLMSGVAIRVVKKSIFGGPVQFKIREYYVSLRLEEARDILIAEQ